MKSIYDSIYNQILQKLHAGVSNWKDIDKNYPLICDKLYQASLDAGYPLVAFSGKMYLFTGSHLKAIDNDELMIFIKRACEKLSGNRVSASRKELINSVSAQLPYTTMAWDVKQSQNKINFWNGTLDLKTMTLVKHDWRDYFRYILPYNYDPVADCPAFKKYLNEVMPEKEAQDVLAEYIGWLFTPGLKLEKILFLYGSGCNGKSVFVEIIEALVGKDNVSHESLSDLCGEYGANSRANLAGKILNTCSDVAPNAFAGDLLKRLASQGPVSMKTLYKDVITTDEYAKMLFCLNELPKTNDVSNGFYRRFLIAPFQVQIPKSKIDPDLSRKIISQELPGIMNWVLEGRKRLVANKKFTESPLMNRALEEYRSRSVKKKRSLLLPPFFQA